MTEFQEGMFLGAVLTIAGSMVIGLFIANAFMDDCHRIGDDEVPVGDEQITVDTDEHEEVAV